MTLFDDSEQKETTAVPVQSGPRRIVSESRPGHPTMRPAHNSIPCIQDGIHPLHLLFNPDPATLDCRFTGRDRTPVKLGDSFRRLEDAEVTIPHHFKAAFRIHRGRRDFKFVGLMAFLDPHLDVHLDRLKVVKEAQGYAALKQRQRYEILYCYGIFELNRLSECSLLSESLLGTFQTP
jgi:hypothetical protein